MDVSGLAQNGEIDGISYKNGKYSLEKDIKWFNSTYTAYITLGFATGNGYEFDGKGHTITIETINNAQASNGLFLCTGTSTNYVTVKNLTVKMDTHDSAGGIIIGVVGSSNASVYFTVENCTHKGIVNGGGSGGICGPQCSHFTAKHCKHEGLVLSNELQFGGSAGICGAGCFNFVVEHSKSEGHLGINGSAGICGSNCNTFTVRHCENHGSVGTINPNNNTSQLLAGAGICSFSCTAFTIEHCSHYGNINDASAGGIVGSQSYGTITVKDCKSKGTLYGSYGGGICGQHTGYIDTLSGSDTNVVIIERCKFEGDIVNNSCGGGIVGEGLGHQSYTIDVDQTITQSITINDCEFVGKMLNTSTNSCGGIVGYSPLYSNVVGLNTHTLTFNVTLNIKNCVVKTELAGADCAGICASDYFHLTDTVTYSLTNAILVIDGCVVHGNILNDSYGILGVAPGNVTPAVTVSNSYTTGYITSGSYGIAGQSNTNLLKMAITNCYAYGHLDPTGAFGLCSLTNSTITNSFSRDTRSTTGGQNLHFIKGRSQTYLTGGEWETVKDSYPILLALKQWPWNKHYDNFLETPSLK